MRRLLRFFLLAMGCAVMVATSRASDSVGPSFTRVELRPGSPRTVTLKAVSRDKDTPLAPQVHLEGLPGSEGSHARVVVFVSEGVDPTAKGVELNGPFTVGQEVEGLGTVAFLYEVPFNTRGEDGRGGPWVLPEAKSYVVNVLAQNAPVSLSIEMANDEMASACHCSVSAGFDGPYEAYLPSGPGPDGGVGDGGVEDGG